MPNRPPTDAPTSQQGIDRLALTARLHETLAQDLAVLGFRLDELIADSTLAPEHRAEIREIRLSMVEISRRFRDDIYLTNHRSREEIKAILARLLQDFQSELDLSYSKLQTDSEFLLNEVLVEIARNSVRHSGARSFVIFYEPNDDGIELRVSDDGRGLPSPSRKNLGLTMIDQSLKMIGCSYICSSTPQGTTYRIQIPHSIILNEPSR